VTLAYNIVCGWSLGGIGREIITSASETKTLTPVFVP